MIDTCQANTMFSKFYSPNILATGSSKIDQNSYSVSDSSPNPRSMLTFPFNSTIMTRTSGSQSLTATPTTSSSSWRASTRPPTSPWPIWYNSFFRVKVGGADFFPSSPPTTPRRSTPSPVCAPTFLSAPWRTSGSQTSWVASRKWRLVRAHQLSRPVQTTPPGLRSPQRLRRLPT